MTKDISPLLEQVMGALHAAEGDQSDLIAQLRQTAPDVRAITIVLALLLADASLRATFAAPARAAGVAEADLARAAALHVARAADAAEEARPIERAVRLGDLTL